MGCGKGDDVEGVKPPSRGCVCEVVRAILEIQNAAVQDGCSGCNTNCFLEPLGGIVSPARSTVNTRVFTLLTKDGSPFFAQFSMSDDDDDRDRHDHGDDDACVSIYFRVEDVFDGCCATLRVLVPLNENGGPINLLNKEGTKLDFREICKVRGFGRSDSCVTVDLDCFCAVQCIADVDLDICN